MWRWRDEMQAQEVGQAQGAAKREPAQAPVARVDVVDALEHEHLDARYGHHQTVLRRGHVPHCGVEETGGSVADGSASEPRQEVVVVSGLHGAPLLEVHRQLDQLAGEDERVQARRGVEEVQRRDRASGGHLRGRGEGTWTTIVQEESMGVLVLVDDGPWQVAPPYDQAYRASRGEDGTEEMAQRMSNRGRRHARDGFESGADRHLTVWDMLNRRRGHVYAALARTLVVHDG
ncbi:hypothetical protein VTK73DRAFT_10165 [Phialemonium thermophilum]|uniref:Uncharacterized protein n=1 Tax=Phialemonium thermophilum TaxID=223376 RepID=A0ABR3VY88_9PEZI